MDSDPKIIKEFCRRRWLLRTAAIRQSVDGRNAAMGSLATPLSDREMVNRDAWRRLLRAPLSDEVG